MRFTPGVCLPDLEFTPGSFSLGLQQGAGGHPDRSGDGLCKAKNKKYSPAS